MTRRFRVTIGGITYQVEVEEVNPAVGATSHGVGYTAPHLMPAPAAAPTVHSGAERPGTPALAVTASPAPAAGAAAPAASAPAAPRPVPTATGEVVRAPLPGMVVATRCEVGQAVSAGDVLVVLEAMKMENDITAPVSGVVREVLVEKGGAVALGDALVVVS